MVTLDPVRSDVVKTAGKVHLMAMCEVTPVVQPHGEDRVTGLQTGEVDAHVHLRPRVGLDVRVIGSEERLCAVDGDLLDLVDDLTAPVVPPAGIPLRVLVRRDAANSLEDA